MRLHVLPGDHVTLVMERGGAHFAEVVRGAIQQAMDARLSDARRWRARSTSDADAQYWQKRWTLPNR
jgi:hypothetical protein